MKTELDYELREPKLAIQAGQQLVQFAVAGDGTPLKWLVKKPDKTKFPPPWFAVLGIHGGGFRDGGPSTPMGNIGTDLTAEGFIVFCPEYRLAPPGTITGQNSDGRYPDQTDDILLAYNAAKKNKQVKGNPQAVGGSAGGYFCAWLSALGLASGVSHSGASQIDDADSRQTHPGFASLCDNYAPGNLGAASPNGYVTAASRPMFITTFTVDSMPPRQATLMAEKLGEYEVETVLITLPGQGHAWPAWKQVKTQAIEFLHKYKAE